MISRALQQTPDSATHWSTRALGRRGYFQEHGAALVWPLRGQAALGADLQVVHDPFFIEKVRDIVALYLNDHAMVRREVADSGAQSHPVPMGLGYVEGYTHDRRDHAVCGP